MVPEAFRSELGKYVTGDGHYGAGHEHLDTYSQIQAGFVPTQGASTYGGVKTDRVWLNGTKCAPAHRAPASTTLQHRACSGLPRLPRLP